MINEQKDDRHSVQPLLQQCTVGGSALSVHELRTGNQVYYVDDDQPEPMLYKIDWQDLKWLEEKPNSFNECHKPILLTEEMMLKIRRKEREDFNPLEFRQTPPGQRQVENNYWSSWINDDYRLHLSPSYGSDWIDGKPVRQSVPQFWFCWYQSQGQWFLPIKNIRGENQLRFVHQLQNLFYALSGKELFLS